MTNAGAQNVVVTGRPVDGPVSLTGPLVAGSAQISGNLAVGTPAPLGDNGTGELQLANATLVPTANPAGGVTMYSVNGGIYVRDPNGVVSSLITTIHTGSSSFGAVAETINHNAATQSGNTPASGELQLMSVGVPAGKTISTVGFVTANTAANGPTHWWAVLLDKNFVQQAHSADQTTAALPASTWQALSFVTPYTTTYTGLYYIGLMIATSTTQPTVLGTALSALFVTGANVPGPPVGGRSSTGLTTPGTDGVTTYIAPTGVGGYYYAYAI